MFCIVEPKSNSFLLVIYLICTISNQLTSVSVCFFLVFLVNHSIDKRLRQILVLFCEVHFSILYILQLELVSSALVRCGTLTMAVLSQLGAHSYFWCCIHFYPCVSFTSDIYDKAVNLGPSKHKARQFTSNRIFGSVMGFCQRSEGSAACLSTQARLIKEKQRKQM